MHTETEAATKRYQCRHIFTDGRRCGSPCLRHEEFCYYHHTTRRPVENPADRRARQSHFDLPLPEDRAAIQLSIGEVLCRIAANEIDPKRAGLLLYGLQIASLNLPREAAPTRDSRTEESTFVEEIVADPTYGTLAPRAEVTERKTVIQTLLENLRDLEPQPTEEEEEQRPEEEPTKEQSTEEPRDTHPSIVDAHETPAEILPEWLSSSPTTTPDQHRTPVDRLSESPHPPR